MNPKFNNLPDEKRQDILNAAILVFSKHPYRLANTNDIVVAAGISKGLLFHYFGTKKALYLYVLEYSIRLVNEQMTAQRNEKETDFFEILIGAMRSKLTVLTRHPHIYDFLMRFSQEDDKELRQEFLQLKLPMIGDDVPKRLKNADHSRFRPGIDPDKIIDLAIWSGNGFMQSKLQEGVTDIDSMLNGYIQILELLRTCLYQDEGDTSCHL